MKEGLKLFLGLLLVLTSFSAQAQDPQFSQFYAAPLFINPAFTGAGTSARVGTILRDQWPAIPNASFITSSSYFDYFFEDFNSGVGGLVTVDRAGSIGPVTTNVSLNYAYQLPITRSITFRPGATIGYTFVNQPGNLEFTDPSENFTGASNSYFDLGLGGLLYTKDFWIGYSAFHLNKPNQSVLGEGNTPLPIRMNVHIGYRLPLYMPGSNRRGYNMYGKERSITPVGIYRRQGSFSNFQVGLYATLEPIVIGMWYRGAPSFEGENINAGGLRSDAVIALLGYTSRRMNIGYSFDYTLSQLGIKSGGGHEISFRYEFNMGKKKPPKNVRQIPCPNF